MKKLSIALFISIIIAIISGCGGGGGGINTSPTPPPTPSGYTITVSLSNNTVQEGNEVYVKARVSPDPPSGSVITWSQEPASPAGSFNPPSGFQTTWTAPKVSSPTTFTLKASLSVGGAIYFGVASITVQPQQAPPQNPPTISLDYPTSEQVVGTGTLLTILGSISQGSNALREIQVLDSDGTVLQRWSATPGAFRVDLSNFGSPGRKVLEVRIVDSAGLYGEQSISIINNEALLDEAAREFLQKYSCDAYSKTIRFGDLTTGPYTVPVNIYLDSSLGNHLSEVKDTILKAEEFWKHYTGIEFQYINSYPPRPQDPKTPVIGIGAWWDKEGPGGAVAITSRGTQQDIHELTDVGITLYKGWLDEPYEMKKTILAHEIGHVILTMSHVDDFGPLFIMSSAGDAGGSERIIPPIVQHAIKLLYSNPPGWQP
jgi:hypothetical protein